MSESNPDQLQQTLLYSLVILLLVTVGFLGWYAMNTKNKLDDIRGYHAAVVDTHVGGGQLATSMQSGAVIPPAHSSSTNKKNNRQPVNTPPVQSSTSGNNFFNQPVNAQNWNPYEEMQRMQRDMDKAFNHAFNGFHQNSNFQHFFKQNILTPEMDIHESASRYTVIVNLPGADAKDISVNLDGQTLTVKGEQSSSRQDKNSKGHVIYQERRSGMFQRSITLPKPVQQNGMKTQVKNGVLTVTIQKQKQ